MLPQDFLNRMKEMLGDEYAAFLQSYDTPNYQALRLNTWKGKAPQFQALSSFVLQPVPWAKDGFYYDGTVHPGKHPYHEAGVYYIQEPSAMAPAEYLLDGMASENSMEEERILDLCAAPGGKSTQIAAAMQGKGLLVCNEIHPARAKILSENIERMGIVNAMVLNETPQRLAEVFTGYFTRILVDAPCSGEGMFRKNEEACGEWSLSNVELCADRQDEILDCAANMLMPGGRLVYSTCTFAPAENEGSISRFLDRHPEYVIEEVKKANGMTGGVAAWTKDAAEGIEKTIRLWPHKIHGEGHYLAVLRRMPLSDTDNFGKKVYASNGVERGIPEKSLFDSGKGCPEFFDFRKEELCKSWKGIYLKFGDQLYLAPEHMPAVKGLKVLRPGLHLGTLKKNRFEPSHALALALKSGETVHQADLSSEGREIRGYLSGETFAWEGEKGWYLVTVDGYSIGWGKLTGGVMKNHYPKGLRKKL